MKQKNIDSNNSTMAVIKLSRDIQSLFSSSYNIASYQRTIEELVFNSLDSKATSIAVRVHIQENKLQVVDNGCGIAKEDFNLLGQRYATSKFTDLSCLKSAPNTYGFRGQALASIVDVSRAVKITSKAENSEETWVKIFHEGKENKLIEATTRPSKGTTVEVTGFLYNLHIQNKTVNILHELQNIKTFLEGISLVHSHKSVSLRDDFQNEILFQVHKNRDIYQTLKSLFDIDKADVQELKVEKSQYKAVAYIGKNLEHSNQYHWIFLNNKIVINNKLNKIVKDSFTKSKRNRNKKVKSKIYEKKGEYNETKNHIPFYFIFLSCPYYDYDINYTPKQSALEFKNWDQIKKIIEKLIKFYMGDTNLKNCTTNTNPTNKIKIDESNKTREQVKNIIHKILGSNSKKPCVSQLQNGIKGKLVKRKKKPKKSDITMAAPAIGNSDNVLKKLENTNVKANKKQKDQVIQIKRKEKYTTTRPEPSKSTVVMNKLKKKKKVQKHKIDPLITCFEKPPDLVKERCNFLAEEVNNLFNYNQKRKRQVYVNETVNYSSMMRDNKKISIRKRVGEVIIHDYIPLQSNSRSPTFGNNYKPPVNNVYKSSYDLVKTILGTQNNQQYSSELSKIHETNYETQKTIYKQCDRRESQLNQLTFESHHYNCNTNRPIGQCNDNVYLSHQYDRAKKTRNNQFISKESRNNFVVPPMFRSTKTLNQRKFKPEPKNKMKYKLNLNKIKSSKFIEIGKNFNSQSIPTIEFCESENNNNFNLNKYNLLPNDKNSPIERTYSISSTNKNITEHNSTNKAFTYTITNKIIQHDLQDQTRRNFNSYENITGSSICTFNNIEANVNEDKNLKPNLMNVVFLSNSLNSSVDAHLNNIYPLNVCETILTNEIISNINKELSIHGDKLNDSLFNLTSMELSHNNLDVSRTETIDHDRKKSLQQHNLASTQQNKTNVSEEIGDVRNNTIQCSQHSRTTNDLKTCNMEDAIMESNYFTVENQNHNLNETNNRPEVNDFKLNNRLRFLPKGMSQIFQNCQTKNNCDYNLDKEYFKDELYKNFINNVQVQSEAYEANVQSPKNVSTKDIAKVSARLDKDNASLTFNAQSIKEAKVLRQVDNKFIACIVQSKSKSSKYLVLFDQHAVHERIRLEQNLSEYYNGVNWKSVKLDDVLLKLSKDEIMYLHNYKEKFTYFGLQWTILNNNEVLMHAIPEAIIGKNPRQVEKVIQAVKSLISEEIIIIKSQKGCVSLYPKSIMDLVFSEACRYAIKFGDPISKDNCVELLQSLSICKTPFQCAHGRPVMAVLTEINTDPRKYKFNIANLRNVKLLKNKV